MGLPEREIVVGYIGKLVPEKGIVDLLQALESLGSRAPFLAIWGSGLLSDYVQQAVDARRIRGRFGGALDFSEVPNALGTCDIIAMPSRSAPYSAEQFGRVALEAMLSECAVIAYKTGALPEVLGDGGVLVDEGDVRSLSRELDRLSRDSASRREVAKKGRLRATTTYDPNVLAERLIGLWNEVADR
jgi:glycosyltransferase involved in cell wall biosynthesis